MKARFLIPGSTVKVDGRVMTFIKRVGKDYVFHCDDYVDLDGPEEKHKGLCTMKAGYFAKHATCPTVRESRTARASAVKCINGPTPPPAEAAQ